MSSLRLNKLNLVVGTWNRLDRVVGAWVTNSRKIVAYATFEGVEIDCRPAVHIFHLGLYEIKADGDVRLACSDEVRLSGNLTASGFVDELSLINLCNWGTRIAKAKPTPTKFLTANDLGLIDFCYEMNIAAKNSDDAPPSRTSIVNWNGIASYGERAGRIANA